MNRKQILLLLAALAVLGTLGWWSLHRENASWGGGGDAAGEKVLGDFDLNAVAQVVITSGENVVHLVRKDEAWTVKERFDYPAGFTPVANLVRKLWEVKIVQVERVGPSQLGRLNLEMPAKGKTTTGTLVDLQDAGGKRIAALLLGKPFTRKSPGMPDEAPGMPVGRHVLAVRDGAIPALVNEAFLDANAVPAGWLDPSFIQPGQITFIQAQLQPPAESWTITRKEGDDWKLADLKPSEKMEPAKANAAAMPWQAPTFNDVRPISEAKGFEKPAAFTVKTGDHFTYQITVGAPEGDLLPVKVTVNAQFPPTRTPGEKETPEQKTQLDADYTNKLKQLHDRLLSEKRLEKWVFLAPKTSFENVLVPRSTFLAPPPTPTPAPASPAAAPPTAPAAP